MPCRHCCRTESPTYRPSAGGWATVSVGRIIALKILNRFGVTAFNGLPIVAFAIDRHAPVPLVGAYSYRMQNNFSAPGDAFERLSAATQPFAVVAGAQDEIFYADRYAPVIHDARPDVPVVLVPGVNHMGMVVAPAGLAAVVAAVTKQASLPAATSRSGSRKGTAHMATGALILQHTPLWVWGVLLVLIVTGVQALRPRVLPVWRLFIVPAVFIAWGVESVVLRAMAQPSLAFDWLAAAVAGIALGWVTVHLGTFAFEAQADRARSRYADAAAEERSDLHRALRARGRSRVYRGIGVARAGRRVRRRGLGACDGLLPRLAGALRTSAPLRFGVGCRRAGPRRLGFSERSSGGNRRLPARIEAYGRRARTMKIAWYGAGMMGSGFVEALRRLGDEVVVWNRTPEKAKALERFGAVAAIDPRAAARGADEIHMMLSDDASVDALLAQLDGAIESRTVVIDHTTVAPGPTAERFARCEARGIAFLHAPVFMSPQMTRERKGIMLVSGSEAVFARAKDKLAQLTGDLWYLGDQRDKAAALKLFGNEMLIFIVAGLADVFALARATGIESTAVMELFQHFKPAGTIDVRGKKIAEGDFSPAFELVMARKDVRLMLESAAAGGVSLAVLPAIAKRMDELIAQGHGQEDLAVLGADSAKSPAAV